MTQPREKRLNRAKKWLTSQNFTEDSRIIKAYRKHFKVDKLCAIRELGMLGVLSPEKTAEYEAQWSADPNNKRNREREEREEHGEQHDNNDLFFIAGYTSGGVPYSLTWEEEMEFERAEEKVQELRNISRVLAEQEADSETEATEAEIEKIEALLEAPYWIIDILPEQVPENSGGQYFAVEEYFLHEPQRSAIKQKHANVILKLNCYEDIFIESEMNPVPKSIVKAIKARHIDVILDDALITSEPDETYITVYNVNEELLALLKRIAASEGLFVWKPDKTEDNTEEEK